MSNYKIGEISNYFLNKRKEVSPCLEIESLFQPKEVSIKVDSNIVSDVQVIKNKEKKVQHDNAKIKLKPSTRKEQNIANASKRLKIKSYSSEFNEKNKRTIFVGNVSNKVQKKDLLKLFEKCGKITSIRLRSVPVSSLKLPKKALVIKKDFNPNRHNMNAYVIFENAENCNEALLLNGTEFHGFHLRVDKVKNSKQHDIKNSIFIGNLPFDIEEEELREFFEDCGGVDNVRVVRDRFTSIGKGIAYVSFKSSESLEIALTMDGTICKKRKVRIMKAAKSQKKFKKKESSASTNLNRNKLNNSSSFSKESKKVVFKKANESKRKTRLKTKSANDTSKDDSFLNEEKTKKIKKSAKKKKLQIKLKSSTLKMSQFFTDRLVK